MQKQWYRLVRWLIQPEPDQWLSILRIGLGFEILFYCTSFWSDWTKLFASGSSGLLNRDLTEAIVSLESPLIPQLGWFVALGRKLGASELLILNASWWILLVAGIFLIIGLFCRSTAILAWLLHLSAVKSGDFAAYGADNFLTIGLFYLMLSPLPDQLAADSWRKMPVQDPHRLGFFRRVLRIHLCLIYFFAGTAKALGQGWWDGTNLWRALLRPPFDIIPAELLVRFKHLLPIAGITVFVLEIGYAFFIWNRATRRIWLIAILLMHASIGVAMGMYLFASIMIILNLAAFGPGILWAPPDQTFDVETVATGSSS